MGFKKERISEFIVGEAVHEIWTILDCISADLVGCSFGSLGGRNFENLVDHYSNSMEDKMNNPIQDVCEGKSMQYTGVGALFS